ncbi:DUF308 domain-containing protein [Candidatus Saccharibacteria bacterium]|nr:DUF308 domain-containing protein [Candidatus Saccharibacteria bacterium]
MGKIEVKDAKKVRKFSMPIYMNVVLLALGIALVIWADKVTSLISIIIGATFLVLAAYNLIAYLRVENRDMKEMPKLVSAIALGIAGGFLIIQNGLIKEVISIVVGIFLLIESIFRLQDALESKKSNPNYKNPLILSIVGIILGMLCIFGKIIIPDLMLQVFGIILIVFSIVDMTGGAMVTQATKKVKAKVIEEQK